MMRMMKQKIPSVHQDYKNTTMKSKTASEELKLRNNIPIDTESNTTISQPGPEDGRDQNIVPDSHSYEPDNGKSKRSIDHNVEVHRTDEDD